MINGELIYLRPIIKDDLKYLNDWKNDEETYKFLGGGFMPISKDQQSNWLDSMIDLTGNNKRYIVCKQSDDNPIGMIGLYGINWIHRTTEVGLYIGDKNELRKGYAKEAYALLENFAKNYLNIRKINLNVVDFNKKAKLMWENYGFQICGKLTEERFIDGRYYDLLIMEKFI
ncbi:GNAT family N-acetyltransferase [Aerococcaceae bacterium INB8]|uniref:GNAT family N-acetyltransferase n=1 Tax=Ruoffia halotolerans TaxID=2748684 RepID=A0A839A8J1_9LACT|nr:GNAT family protein [Ruoffia halotolerans]MBA5730201.1 GNAT family N-acetyltransferase [Ruoffia halotolerans]